MNIFYLDRNPRKAARMHCDDHLRKMVMEYAQLLSTAWHQSPNQDERDLAGRCLIKQTHVNHPSNVWTRSGLFQYCYVFSMWEELLVEYVERYGREHKYTELRGHLVIIPKYLAGAESHEDMPPPPCAFGDYKYIADGIDTSNHDDVVEAYREYYRQAKSGFAKWGGCRTLPRWWLKAV